MTHALSAQPRGLRPSWAFACYRFLVDFLERERGGGTLPPFSRASLSPIAIACLRLVTFWPELLFSVPFLRRRIADSTFFSADFPYLAMATSGKGKCKPRATVQDTPERSMSSIARSPQVVSDDACASAVCLNGSWTMNVDPRSRPGLVASIEPPCSSTRCLAIDRPRPRPHVPRVVDGSAWRKRSKT